MSSHAGAVAVEKAAQEDRFRLMADAAPVLIWMADTSAACTWFNKPWLEFVGRTMAQQVGDGWIEGVHPDDVEQCRSSYREAFDARRPFTIEYRLRRFDGEYRWIFDRGVPLTGPDGAFAGYMGSCVDIHDRRRAEDELRRSVQFAESLNRIGNVMARELEHGRLLQTIVDEARAITGAGFVALFHLNRNLRGDREMDFSVSGAPREVFAALPAPRDTPLLGPAFRGEAVVLVDDVLADPRFARNSPFAGLPPGHSKVRSFLSTPIMNGRGETVGCLLFGHEQPAKFTEDTRRIAVAIGTQAAVALDNARLYREAQEREAHFRQLANAIPQLAWMARPDGWIFWYNDRWYEYTGTTPDQMEDWGWQRVHDPAYLPKVMEAWQDSLKQGALLDMEFPLRGADGQFRWFLTRVAPLRDADGRITAWFGTNTDITEHRRITEERQKLLDAERTARTEVERHSRMKDEFLATLSHELRTPLNAIVGWTALLKRDPSDALLLEEGLEVIDRNARIQTRLISDLLDMSRIISGKLRLDMMCVDLPTVIHAAVEAVRPTAAAKGVKLHVLLDELAGPVTGDPARLQQALWNLMTNAVKFTPEGGQVEVLLERVNSHVEISVADTGIGIRPEFLPLVFDRFQQADSSTTRRHGGLGLGLAIVKQLIELHNGSVRAKSAGEGHGATFIIALPLRVRRDDGSDRAHPTGYGPRVDVCETARTISLEGLRVLLVDDEPDAREIMRRVLSDAKADVCVAASAREAEVVLVERRVDVLLSDIGMPDEDGFQFLRRMRQLGVTVPAIAVTAFARSEDRLRALHAGYQMHLAKPLEPDELLASVASLAGRLGKEG